MRGEPPSSPARLRLIVPELQASTISVTRRFASPFEKGPDLVIDQESAPGILVVDGDKRLVIAVRLVGIAPVGQLRAMTRPVDQGAFARTGPGNDPGLDRIDDTLPRRSAVHQHPDLARQKAQRPRQKPFHGPGVVEWTLQRFVRVVVDRDDERPVPPPRPVPAPMRARVRAPARVSIVSWDLPFRDQAGDPGLHVHSGGHALPEQIGDTRRCRASGEGRAKRVRRFRSGQDGNEFLADALGCHLDMKRLPSTVGLAVNRRCQGPGTEE